MKDKDLINLLNQMTLDEKIGQMVQVAGDIFLEDTIDVSTGPLKNLGLSNEMLYNVGSILNVMGAERVKKVQDEYLSKSRLILFSLITIFIIIYLKTKKQYSFFKISDGSWNIFYKKLKKNDSFTLFNDIEKKLNNSLINDDIDKNTYGDIIRTFVNTVESALGIRTRVYASTKYIYDRFHPDVHPYFSWIADWRSEIGYTGAYEGWQYTSDGFVPGISGRVDMSKFYY